MVGRGRVHRIPLAKLLCVSEKRRRELATRLGESRARTLPAERHCAAGVAPAAVGLRRAAFGKLVLRGAVSLGCPQANFRAPAFSRIGPASFENLPQCERLARCGAGGDSGEQGFQLVGVADGRLAGGVHADQCLDRKSTRLNSSHIQKSRMPSSA